MTLKLNKSWFLLLFDLWWIIFIALAETGFNQFELLNIVGFLSLVFVPGMLTLIAFKIKISDAWTCIALSVALSLLELMTIGLIGNTLLPLIGFVHPLSGSVPLDEITIGVAMLAGIASVRMQTLSIKIRRFVFFERMRDVLFSFFPLSIVLLSILGAISLNDGGNNMLTMIMLALCALYGGFLIYYARRLEKNVIPTALFFISLSLLFMTSLRGWEITGHDIQREFFVFQLTKNAGLWSIGAYHDAYNACLSITILPTIFANTLALPDAYVYKILFQILFALSPVIVYLISRTWTNVRLALLSALFFVSFPTFFEDMPFLNRQEIAFIFFGLMILILFIEELPLKTRQILFTLLGVGLIFSHYSTTYTVVAILALTAFATPIFFKLLKKETIQKRLARSALLSDPIPLRRITFSMVGALVIMSFVWTWVITGTSDSVTSVVSQTFSAIGSGFVDNSRSVDAMSLFTFGEQSPQQEFTNYTNTYVPSLRAQAPPQAYVDASSSSAYPLSMVDDEHVPLSPLGDFFTTLGINVRSMVALFGEIIARVAEILAPIGILFILLRRSIVKRFDIEFFVIAVSCLVFVGCTIALPVLSTQYGVFRALQQSMFVLAPLIIVAAVAIGMGIEWLFQLLRKKVGGSYLRRVREGNIPVTFATLFIIIFFLYSTAFIPQVFGGNVPQLHLNNAGPYYDNYFTHDSEVDAVNWLQAQSAAQSFAPAPGIFQVDADRYMQNKMDAIAPLPVSGDIFPGLVERQAYVFLSEENVTEDRSSIYYDNALITYAYPMQFLDQNKDLVYDNGDVRIYR